MSALYKHSEAAQDEQASGERPVMTADDDAEQTDIPAPLEPCVALMGRCSGHARLRLRGRR